jgi:hypothetical protein
MRRIENKILIQGLFDRLLHTRTAQSGKSGHRRNRHQAQATYLVRDLSAKQPVDKLHGGLEENLSAQELISLQPRLAGFESVIFNWTVTMRAPT